MGGQFQISADLCGQIIRSANPNGYLRLQLELNQRFKRNEENPFCPPKFLPKEQQVNAFTKKKVSEAMDDASEETIKQLLETTEAFIKSDNYLDKKSVKGGIAEFIKNNLSPETIRP